MDSGATRPELEVAVEGSRRAPVVRLRGELDLATVSRLRAELAEVVHADPPPRQVVLELSGLRFVDATGFAVLAAAQRALAARGGRMSVRSPSRLARRLLTLLDTEGALPIER